MDCCPSKYRAMFWWTVCTVDVSAYVTHIWILWLTVSKSQIANGNMTDMLICDSTKMFEWAKYKQIETILSNKVLYMFLYDQNRQRNWWWHIWVKTDRQRQAHMGMFGLIQLFATFSIFYLSSLFITFFILTVILEMQGHHNLY